MADFIGMLIVLLGFIGFILFLRWKTNRDYIKSQEEWDAAHPRAKELLEQAEAAHKAYISFKAEHEDYNKERIDELRTLIKYIPNEYHTEYIQEILTLQADYYRSMMELDELRQEWERAVNEYRKYIE